MQDYFMDPRMQNLQPMGMYDEHNRMFVSPDEELERMYPRIYFIINPVVIRHCDMFDDNYGPSYTPTNEELERMVDNIQMEVEPMVKAEMPEEFTNPGNPDGNPHGNPNGRRNPFLRGLVGTLLVSELLGRRRGFGFRRFPRFFRPFPGFFPVFPGFFPGFF